MAHAFRDEGHTVVVAAGQTVKSFWQTPAPLDVPVLHVPPGPEIVHVSSRLRAFSAAIGAPSTAAGEVRRALYNQELLVQLRQRFEHDPPDVVYERASLFGIAGLTFAREIGVPHLLELNAPLADEQQRYRQGGALRELAETSEAWMLTGTDAVLAVSAPLAEQVVARGVERARVHVVANGVDTTRFHPGGDNEAGALRLGVGRCWASWRASPAGVERCRARRGAHGPAPGRTRSSWVMGHCVRRSNAKSRASGSSVTSR
jgi:glycosyltransferase involved in cell wall biosynthesis